MVNDSVTPLHLVLVGTGRMGKAIENIVLREGRHSITARFDETHPLEDAQLAEADLIIDFSTPAAVLDNIHRYCFWGVNAVIGTTGWYEQLSKVKDWVEEGGNGLLYAPNFSLGVAALVRALRGVLPLMNRLDEYDPYIHELHHKGKIDSPSGTALLLAETILRGLDRKTVLATETQHGQIAASDLHVTSSRAGSAFGEHTVVFDGPSDQLIFQHIARNREAFASGAIRAAEWLRGREGLFTLDDMLAELES